MGPTDKAFNQVKNILGKLDRNIDDVRNKRLHPDPGVGSPVTRTIGESTIPAASSTTLIGVPKQAPTTPLPAAAVASQPRSAFGRARPILPDAPGNSALWKTT